MKKSVFSMLLLAAAAMTTISCSSDVEEFEAQQQNKGGITLVASNPEFEGDTRTLLGTDGLSTLWKAGDMLHTVTNYETYEEGYVTRFDFFGTNTQSSAKAEFKINNAQASSFDDFKAAQNFYAIHGDGFLSCDVDFSSFSMNLGQKQTPTKGQFDASKDILISKSVTIETNRDYEANPVMLQFKRLTGLLKINFKAADSKVQQDALNGLTITSFTMTTNDSSDDFAGTYSVNLADGEITKGEGKGIVGYQLKGFKIGDGNSIYMSVLPTTIKAGQSMKIVLNTSDKTYTKEIKLESDVVIPARTVTTLNISITDPSLEGDPVPGADNKVNVIGNTIDMTGATGTLFKWHVKEALKSNPNQVIMKGAMDAQDFSILLSVLKEIKNPIDLNITDVTVKKSSYTDNENKTLKLIENEFGNDFFVGCNLKSVELPSALEYLGMNAFQNITTLESVRMEAALVKTGGQVFNGCTGMKTLTVLTDPNTDAYSLDANFYAMPNTDSEKVNLNIYYEWDKDQWIVYEDNYYAEPSQNLWYGFTWKSVTLVEADGSIYQ